MDPLRSPASIGWFPDPLRRFDFRYFNGERWTADVSADGTRFVDPGPFSPPPANQGRQGHHGDRHPSRTLALLAFVLALAGIALAWAPFIFVLGGAACVAAIVLGVISLRRTKRLAAAGTVDSEGSGRSLGIAAICIAPVGLGLCTVGVLLTDVTYREFDRYLNPGPHEITETECSLDALRATFAGTIENLADESRDYEILVEFRDDTEPVATSRISVDDVAAGATRTWSTSGRVGDVDLRCEIRNVTGPYPFGLER